MDLLGRILFKRPFLIDEQAYRSDLRGKGDLSPIRPKKLEFPLTKVIGVSGSGDVAE